MSKNAAQNNNKLFPIFRSHLSDPRLTIFVPAADKLASWLSSDRAYYAEAQSMIIELLEVAQATLRQAEANNIPPQEFHVNKCRNISSPMVRSYLTLVRAVCPFRHLLRLPDLVARFNDLLRTVTVNTPHGAIILPATPGPGPTQNQPQLAAINTRIAAQHTQSPLRSPQASLQSPQLIYGPSLASSPRNQATIQVNQQSPRTPTAPGPSSHSPVRRTSHPVIPQSATPTGQSAQPTHSTPAAPPPASAVPATAFATPPFTSPVDPQASISMTPSSRVTNPVSASAPPNLDLKTMRLRPKPKVRKSLNMQFLDKDLEWYSEKQKSHPADSPEIPAVAAPPALVSTSPFTSTSTLDTPVAAELDANQTPIEPPRSPSVTIISPIPPVRALPVVESSSSIPVNRPPSSSPVVEDIILKPSPDVVAPALPTQSPEIVDLTLEPSPPTPPISEQPLPKTLPEVVAVTRSPSEDPSAGIAAAQPPPPALQSPFNPPVQLQSIAPEPLPQSESALSRFGLSVSGLHSSAEDEVEAILAEGHSVQDIAVDSLIIEEDTPQDQPSVDMADVVSVPNDDGAPPPPEQPADEPLTASVSEGTLTARPADSLTEPSRKRASSAGEADMPPRQRRRTSEEILPPVDAEMDVDHPELPPPTQVHPSERPMSPDGTVEVVTQDATPPANVLPQTEEPSLAEDLSQSQLSAVSREEGEILTPLQPQFNLPGSREPGEVTPIRPKLAEPLPSEDKDESQGGESKSVGDEQDELMRSASPSSGGTAPVASETQETKKGTEKIGEENEPVSPVSPDFTMGNGDVPSQEEGQTEIPAYGSFFKILGVAWGSMTPHVDALSFNIPRTTMQELIRWTNREKLEDDVSDSRCISLAAYRFEDLFEVQKRCGNITPEEVFKIQPAPWQLEYDLRLQINDGSTYSLAPPDFTLKANQDHIVDLTSKPEQLSRIVRFKEGENTIKIKHRGCLLGHAWVLSLHSPSNAQLAALARVREQESKWMSFVKSLGSFKPPPISWPPPPVFPMKEI